MLNRTDLASFVRAIAAAGVFPSLAAVAAAQCELVCAPGDPIADARGAARAFTSWDPDGVGPSPLLLVCGGSITAGPVAAGGVVAWDGARWLALGQPPTGEVRALTVWSGLLVAGFHTGPTTAAVAAWNGSVWQTLGTFTGSAASTPELNAFAVHAGDLVVAGRFDFVDGAAANGVARWNGAGWASLGSGVTGTVHALASFGGVLWVGGAITAAGGAPMTNITRWNGASWLATLPFNGPVRALAVRTGSGIAGSFLFAAGDFSQIGSGPLTYAAHAVARFDPVSNSWSTMGSNLAGRSCRALFVRAVGFNGYEVVTAVWNGDLLVPNGPYRWNGAAWDPLGSFPVPPYALHHYGGSYVEGLGASQCVRRLENGAWVSLTGPTFPGPVWGVIDDPAGAVVGGSFGVFGGAPGGWTAMGTLTPAVYTFERLANGDLVAGGFFYSLNGGQFIDSLARWDGAAWQPLSSVNGVVHDLLRLADGDLVIAGQFPSAGGVQAADNIARWDGFAIQPLATGLNGTVRAVVQRANGDIVVGGDFTSVGGPLGAGRKLGRWDGAQWHPMGFWDDSVHALALMPDGDLIVGGAFTTNGNVPLNGLARIRGNTVSNLSPTPEVVLSLLALPNGDLLYATASELMRLSDGSVTQILQGYVYDLALAANGDVLVAGEFDVIGGVVSADFARLEPSCRATANAAGTGCNGPLGPLDLAATALPWVGSTFRARATGLAPGFALVVTGFAPAAVPLAAVLPQGQPGCDLLVSPDALDVALPDAGVVTTALALANSAALVGVGFRQQVVILELDQAFVVAAVRSTNALAMTIGAL